MENSSSEWSDLREAGHMLKSFERLQVLGPPEQIIPGPDALVRKLYPLVAGDARGAGVHRLDFSPVHKVVDLIGGKA